MKINLGNLKSGCRLGALFGIATLTLVLLPASTSRIRGDTPIATAAVAAIPDSVQRPLRTAEFGTGTPSADVRWLANWIADSRDNGNAAFILVDKREAELHVFDADTRWVASTAVLLGAALGDESVPGIGSRPLASIEPGERTTPAGRFVGERGRNATGEDVIWVDYEAAVSMHRVRLTNPRERRAARLASPSGADNRISYGCINVPVAFYEQHIQTLFTRRPAVIYVLPDSMTVQQLFGSQVAATPRSDDSLTLAAGRTANIRPSSQQVSR